MAFRKEPEMTMIKNVRFNLDGKTGEYKTNKKFKGCDLVKWDYKKYVMIT